MNTGMKIDNKEKDKLRDLVQKARFEMRNAKPKTSYFHYENLAYILDLEKSSPLFLEVINQLIQARYVKPWIGRQSKEVKEEWLEVSIL